MEYTFEEQRNGLLIDLAAALKREDEAQIKMTEIARYAQHLQARIDALMLEYCPDEMTPEQIAEWERHQRAVPND